MKATLSAALSIGTITKFSLRENIMFLTSCSLQIGFTALHAILFLRVKNFPVTGDTRGLFHSEKWFLWMSLSFDICSMN